MKVLALVGLLAFPSFIADSIQIQEQPEEVWCWRRFVSSQHNDPSQTTVFCIRGRNEQCKDKRYEYQTPALCLRNPEGE